MFTKIKFFVKGVRLSADIAMIIMIWALATNITELKDEITELKQPRYFNKKPYRKYPKGGQIPQEKPKNPIGFAPQPVEKEDDCENE